MLDEDFLGMVEEARVMNVFRSIRWPNGDVYCPKCKSTKIHVKGLRDNNRRYQCQEKDCELNFNDTYGTEFHYSKLSMSEIFYVLFNLNYKSVKEMAEELEYTRSTINSLVNKFKESFEKNEDLKYDVGDDSEPETLDINDIPVAPMNRILKNADTYRKRK